MFLIYLIIGVCTAVCSYYVFRHFSGCKNMTKQEMIDYMDPKGEIPVFVWYLLDAIFYAFVILFWPIWILVMGAIIALNLIGKQDQTKDKE